MHFEQKKIALFYDKLLYIGLFLILQKDFRLIKDITERSLVMLTERYIDGINQRYQAEFNNVSKEILPWLEDVAVENNCKIDRKEWKSKYNSYVIYDYEPFCSDGFEINLVVSSFSKEHLDFLKYLYENKVNTIEYLNKCVIN